MERIRESNQSLFTWCLFLLGGSERPVDVEEIFQKCFAVSPSRFAWRTRPDLPDSKKLSKALVDAEMRRPLLIVKYDVHTRGLSYEGLSWIEANKDQLQELYGGKVVLPSKSNTHRKLASSLRGHEVWSDFEEKNADASIFNLADALNCSPGSPTSTWTSRIEELRISAAVLEDEQLKEFADFASDVYRKWRD